MIHAAAFAVALTFNDAYARALAARGLATAYAVRVVPPPETHPAIRFEASAQRAQDVVLRPSDGTISNDGLFNAGRGSALVAVDVPIVDRAARLRRTANAETDALLFRRHAIDEADDLFDQTLDTFAQLIAAERRLDFLTAAAKRGGELPPEQALAAESQAVDAELQRLDAEIRLKELMASTDRDPIDAVADLDDADAVPAPAAGVDLAELRRRKQQLLFDEVQAQRRPQVLLTGYGGKIGGAGIAGVRLSVTLPFYDATRVAEAKLQLEEAARAKTAAAMAERTDAAQLRAALEGADKRVALLARALELARQQKSPFEITRRQCDLVGAQVERWKLRQRLMRTSAPVAPLQASR